MEAEEKKENGEYDLKKLGVSFLWLCWRIYECWDVIYFDYLSEKSHLTKEGRCGHQVDYRFINTHKLFRKEYLRKLREEERKIDEAFIEGLTVKDHPYIRRVQKAERDTVILLLSKTYHEHPLTSSLTLETPEKTSEAILWYWGEIVGNTPILLLLILLCASKRIEFGLRNDEASEVAVKMMRIHSFEQITF